MHRRTLLRSLSVALPLGLAGCTSDGDGDDTTDGTPTTVTTEAPSGSDATSTPTYTTAPGTTGVDASTDTSTRETETAAVTSPSNETPTLSPTRSPTETPPSVAQVVEVAPDRSLSFSPESFEVSVGDTVRWVWRAGGHNVRPDETPRGTDWGGTPGGDSKTYDGGYEHSHTFGVAGEYSYYCNPHRGAGMTGSFTVTE